MTGVSTYGQSLAQIERLKAIQSDFSLLSYQLSTGKKTNKFSGLGSDILYSKRARADFKALETYQNNITLADNRAEHTLTALKEFRAQTENLRAFMVNFSQEAAHQKGDYIRQDDPLTPDINEAEPIGYNSSEMEVDFKTMANFASNIEEFLIELMNRQEQDRYLFSGSDTLTKPLTSTATLNAQMETAITNWKNESSATNISTTDFISDLQQRVATATNPDAFSDTVVGYNANLVSGKVGNVYARTDANSQVNYTSLANNEGFRNVLVAVSFLKSENLPPIADVYAEPYTYGDTPTVEGAPGATLKEQEDNFFAVFNALTGLVNDALDQLDSEIQNLELARVRLNDAKTVNSQQKQMALEIIGNVEDVDTTEVAVKVNSIQISLEASYRMTAMMQELSLVNFI